MSSASFAWTQFVKDRIFPSDELIELRQAKEDRIRQGQKSEQQRAKDEILLNSTSPIRKFTIDIYLKKMVMFTDLLPFDSAFEFTAPEAPFDFGFRLLTRDIQAGHDGKRTVAFFTTVSHLYKPFELGYGFASWEHSSELISIPVTLDARFDRFVTIRDFDGVGVEAFLATNLIPYIREIRMTADDFVLLTIDPQRERWTERPFTLPPAANSNSVQLGAADRKWRIDVSAGSKVRSPNKSEFSRGFRHPQYQ